MEPERKIEKLLRAYAKKRRADADDSLKLHPVTRRRLQREVAAHAAKPDEAEADMSLWELLRRQWAVLAGFALVIFFGATLILPALSKAKFKAQSASAMSNLRQIGVAMQMAAEENNGRLPASLDALTNQFLSGTVLTDIVSGWRFTYVAGGESLDGLSSNAVLAYSPTDQKGRAVLFADGHVELVKSDRFAALTNRAMPGLVAMNETARREPETAPATLTTIGGNIAAAPPVLAPAKPQAVGSAAPRSDLGAVTGYASSPATPPVAAPAPALNEPNAAQLALNKDFAMSTNAAQFASAASQAPTFGLRNFFTNTGASDKAAPVLARFQVQQNGTAIRIVDADGSVYEGSLLPENAVAQKLPAEIPPTGAPAQMERAKSVEAQNASSSAQNHFFRVTGTNQTLKESVVFTGYLLTRSDVKTDRTRSSGGGSGGGGGGASQLEVTNQLPRSAAGITGTAVIAGTNNIEINAVPVP
jgi:prepilin-type processing-associated H-X9-DG protein